MACCSIHPSWPVQRSVGHKELNGDTSVVSRHNSTKRQNTANVGKLGLTFSRPVKRPWRQLYQPSLLWMKFMHALFKAGCASRTRRFAGCLSASKEIYSGQFLTHICSQGLISWYPAWDNLPISTLSLNEIPACRLSTRCESIQVLQLDHMYVSVNVWSAVCQCCPYRQLISFKPRWFSEKDVL